MTKTELIEYCYFHSITRLNVNKMYRNMKKADLINLYTKMRTREYIRDILPFCEKTSNMYIHYTTTIRRLSREIPEMIETFKISSDA